MKTEQLENLKELARRVMARRAVACKHWRWMPGMRTSEGWRVIRGSTESRCMAYDENPENWQVADNYIQDGTLPDLRDPATLGCLLAIVREAHNAPDAYLMGSVTKQWVVHHFAEPEGYWKPLTKWQRTEAEALVAALEAAP